MSMLHGTGPSQSDPAAVPDGLGYAIRAALSHLAYHRSTCCYDHAGQQKVT